MPTYQYACTECSHSFEQFQSFTDDTLTVCPECDGRLRKVFNAVGVVFKGSGFYRTDSRADARSASGSGTDSSDSSDSSGSGKSESGKPESSKSESGKTGSGSSAPAAAGAGSSGSSTSPSSSSGSSSD